MRGWYSGRVWVIEQMLHRMFIGVPPGAYDRLLDFSTAVTGATFFVPTAPCSMHWPIPRRSELWVAEG